MSTNLGPRVSTRSILWTDLVQKAWGSEFHAPDHGAYQFSRNRKFDSTDKYLTGLYGVPGDTLLVLDGQQYPDMRDGLIVAVGTPPGSAEAGLGSYEEISADPRS